MLARFLISFFVSWIFALHASAIEVSNVVVAGKKFTVCRVNIEQERLQIFMWDEARTPLRTFETINKWLKPRGEQLLFGMNAGMYKTDYSPLGLLVIQGKELAPINSRDGTGNFYLKPNGVFVLSDEGVRVVATPEYPQVKERIILATQSGPMLVQGGKIHPVFNPKSTSRYVRNGVGIPSRKVAVFAISEEPVTFHEFATLFRDVLQCPDALYLDGLISNLYLREPLRNNQEVSLGPIIGITGTVK